MRGTKFALGLAMLGVTGALFSYPVGAKAAPQLTMATGVGVAPQINTGNLPGGKRAISGAKKNNQLAQERANEANNIMSDPQSKSSGDLSALPDKVYSAAELILAVQKDPQSGQTLVGKPVKAEGIVLKVDSGKEFTTVYLGAPNANGKSPIFAFRLGGTQEFELGKVTVLEGKFVARTRVEGFPNDIYVVNAHGESSPDRSANADTEEKAPFDGWKFVGAVEADGGATGVFVREGKVIYAQSGDKLGEGVNVVRIKAGEAVLRDGKKLSVVSPW